MKVIRRTLIGIFAIFICGIFTGFGSLIAISILCTGGIALVVWLPLAYIFGGIIEKAFTKKAEVVDFKEDGSERREVLLTNNQIALVNYIRESRLRGASEEAISSELRSKGWLDEEVKVARDYIASHPN